MYLQAGVRVVWLVDPIARTVSIFGQDDQVAVLKEDDAVDGGDVLPGFSVRIGTLIG